MAGCCEHSRPGNGGRLSSSSYPVGLAVTSLRAPATLSYVSPSEPRALEPQTRKGLGIDVPPHDRGGQRGSDPLFFHVHDTKRVGQLQPDHSTASTNFSNLRRQQNEGEDARNDD